MLHENAAWTFTSKRPLTRWFEHVHLLSDRVLGYWFCLDRSSGQRLWERHLAADEIVGIEDDIIVANERRRMSFSSKKYNCYGISLQTGGLLWTSHSSGFWGCILTALDIKDYPVYVLDGRCYCSSGRILDVKTGKLIERVQKEEIVEPEEPETETNILGRSKKLDDPVKLKVADGLWLSHKLEAKQNLDPTDKEFSDSVWNFRLFLTGDQGKEKWQFDVKDTGYEMCYCLYAEKCRYSFPYLYLLACEKRTTKMQGKTEVYNPSQFHLLTLSLDSGSIVQDIQITESPVDQCRFEDIDETGVLVSDAERTLSYFERC